jgi:hypothetical protein
MQWASNLVFVLLQSSILCKLRSNNCSVRSCAPHCFTYSAASSSCRQLSHGNQTTGISPTTFPSHFLGKNPLFLLLLLVTNQLKISSPSHDPPRSLVSSSYSQFHSRKTTRHLLTRSNHNGGQVHHQWRRIHVRRILRH